MAILNNNPLVGASGNQGGYNINNSLRFRSSASAYLSRTPSSSGNRQKWTWSGWVKRGALSDTMLFHCQISSTDKVQCRIDSNHNIAFLVRIGNVSGLLITSRVLRDPSAWYHIMFVCDTTQATATTQFKIYVNGVEETSFSSSSATTQNGNSAVNSTTSHQIGYDVPNASSAFDGYLAETYLIDGQALTPSSFGETDAVTGVWKPKAYTGTYGTNGFYLKFSDIATTSGSNAGLGKDFSGNSNYWTTNNISVTAGTTYDAMTDVPTLTSVTVANYAVMNPLNAISTTGGNTTTLSNANLSVLMPNTAGSRTAFATMGVSSGKWYWETTITTGSINTYYPGLGIDTNLNALPTDQSGGTASGYMYLSNGQKFNNSSLTAYGSSFTTNDVIGVALDMDAGTITFYKNNTSQGQAFSGITGTAVPCVVGQNNAALAINFGQRPFTYTPPTGFVALNTYNLPTPTILQGNKYMDATLWTGNGTVSGVSQTITNASAFKPDFVWVKSRSNAYQNALQDSVRGAGKTLFSALTNAEAGNSGDLITSFNSNGFTVNTTYLGGFNETTNNSGSTYVGWQWQAGQGSTSSNTAGSITSTVSVNTTAGFSVVTYTGTGSAATVGHGLGVAPKMIIVKCRSAAFNWAVYHANLTSASYYLSLNQTIAQTNNSTLWNGTAPTSTVFSVGTAGDTNAGNLVAYCWADVSGYSKAFSYTGNGSTDGSFVYTGFLPRFVLIKRTDTTGDWYMWDTARNTYDVITNTLLANSSAAETSATSIDALSNGFKLRNTTAGFNASGGTYVGMAWATNPFKNSNAF